MCRLHMSCFHSLATLLLLFSIEVYVFTKLLPKSKEFLTSLFLGQVDHELSTFSMPDFPAKPKLLIEWGTVL